MRERRKAAYAKPLLVLFLSGAMLFIVLGTVRRLLGARYFSVRHIVSTKADVTDLAYLKGKNIFSIDLKKESEFISELYPSYSKVRLIRVLPDRLFVDFTRRRPLAYVKLFRYFCVDEDQMLFDVPAQLDDPQLPLITGLESKIFGPKSGRRYQVRELALATQIIREVNANPVLKDVRVKVVNVAQAADASFFIGDSLEVKIGQEEIKNRVAILGTLLAQSKKELRDIHYVDLRFKEPVIKFKTQP